jgi:serine/threonine protein kinase
VLRQRALPLCEAATKALFEDLLRALHACHARSVLHRVRGRAAARVSVCSLLTDASRARQDVKPANLLLGRDGRLKLADFGNACVVEPGKTLRVGSTTRRVLRPAYLCALCSRTRHVRQVVSCAGAALRRKRVRVPC